MKSIIDELKDEHSLLVETLQAVKRFGISNPKGRECLINAKKFLLSHLQKEDEQLYPFLRSQAKEDEVLNNMLNMFARDMESVSLLALSFFNKYENFDAITMEFAKDFGILYASLGNRIRKEESILYDAYIKLNSANV